MASLVEKVTRAALGLVAAQSPDRAGEMAFWLFTRTRSTKPQSDKERKALELAKARMDESETVRLVIPGSVIATHVFRPGPDRTGGQRVLLVHGYRSRSDHMIALADALVAAATPRCALIFRGTGRRPAARFIWARRWRRSMRPGGSMDRLMRLSAIPSAALR
jgi:hypothetical protein